MKTWTSALALFVAGAMLVGTASAQQPMAPSSEKPMGKDSATGASETKSDTMKSGRGGGMAGAKGEQVKAAQQALKDKGHDPGAIDGMMGPKTQAAVRDFQSKEGLKASGRLDTETLAKLGVDAKGASGMPSTTPSASPPSSGSGTTGSTGAKSPSTK